MPLELDEDFEARYSTVMDGMLRSAVAETTRLYEAMVEELRQGICTMRRENDALRSRCTRPSAAAASAAREPRRTRQDACVQCDLIPVGALLMGQDDNQKPGTHGDGSHLLMKEGDGQTLISGQEPPTEEPYSNGGPTALQQEHREGDNDSSCERGSQSQLSEFITPPRPLEKMAQQSDVTRQLSVTSASSETEADVLILDQVDPLIAGRQQPGFQHPTCSEKLHHDEISVTEQYDIAFKPPKTIASLSEGAVLTEENPSAATELQRRKPKHAQGVHSSPSVLQRDAVLPVTAKNAQITVPEAATGNQLPAVTSHCACTQTCSSISTILVETKVPPCVIPVFQQKRSLVVRLTRLSVPALTKEEEPVLKIPVYNIKEEIEPIPLTPVLSVQETEAADIKPTLSKIRFPSRAKKVKLVRDHRTPTKTSNESSSSPCPNTTSSESISVSLDKSTTNGFWPKQPIDTISSVSPRWSRSVSKMSLDEPTEVHAKIPRLSLSSPRTVTIPHSTGVQSIPDRAPAIVSPLQPLAVIGRRLLRHQCAVCGRVFGNAAALETHVGQHKLQHPFTCLLCGKTLSDGRSFRRHDKMHRNGKAYVCGECGKGFALRFALTRHYNMVHVGVKPFSCQFCKKDFFSKVELESHLRVHTGEMPFQCNLCERKFKRRMDLNVHLRWHNGEKRYWCSYCGSGFLDANNLKRHTYTHTGERPHQCPHCPKKFTQSGNRKKHLINVHKLDA